MNPEDLVGKKYVFDDDSVIEVIQVKQKEGDEGIVPYVTYHIHQGSSLPRKLVMPLYQWLQHLVPSPHGTPLLG